MYVSQAVQILYWVWISCIPSQEMFWSFVLYQMIFLEDFWKCLWLQLVICEKINCVILYFIEITFKVFYSFVRSHRSVFKMWHWIHNEKCVTSRVTACLKELISHLIRDQVECRTAREQNVWTWWIYVSYSEFSYFYSALLW